MVQHLFVVLNLHLKFALDASHIINQTSDLIIINNMNF